jgi:CRISPR-associated protein Cmr4
MYKQAAPLFFKCETPTHVGSGSDLGAVDLPIQRERHTSFPKFEASSLKGALRERFEARVNTKNYSIESINIHLAFGYDPTNEIEENKEKFKGTFETQFAGALAFTDSRILFFPIKSMKGVYAYITCAEVLNKLKDDLEMINATEYAAQIKAIKGLCKEQPGRNECFSNSQSLVLGKEGQYRVVLEEYAFRVENEDEAAINSGIEALQTLLPDGFADLSEKLIVLKNDDFRDFVNLSTEVITRTKIDNATGTVATGALFTEEYLPEESILYSLIMASPIFQKSEAKKKAINEYFFNDDGQPEEVKVMNYFKEELNKANHIFQIGGSRTLGKGILKAKF